MNNAFHNLQLNDASEELSDKDDGSWDNKMSSDSTSGDGGGDGDKKCQWLLRKQMEGNNLGRIPATRRGGIMYSCCDVFRDLAGILDDGTEMDWKKDAGKYAQKMVVIEDNKRKVRIQWTSHPLGA